MNLFALNTNQTVILTVWNVIVFEFNWLQWGFVSWFQRFLLTHFRLQKLEAWVCSNQAQFKSKHLILILNVLLIHFSDFVIVWQVFHFELLFIYIGNFTVVTSFSPFISIIRHYVQTLNDLDFLRKMVSIPYSVNIVPIASIWVINITKVPLNWLWAKSLVRHKRAYSFLFQFTFLKEKLWHSFAWLKNRKYIYLKHAIVEIVETNLFEKYDQVNSSMYVF